MTEEVGKKVWKVQKVDPAKDKTVEKQTAVTLTRKNAY